MVKQDFLIRSVRTEIVEHIRDNAKKNHQRQAEYLSYLIDIENEHLVLESIIKKMIPAFVENQLKVKFEYDEIKKVQEFLEA